jgi:hypothetical protein
VDDTPRRVSARLRSAMIDPDETPTQKRKREVRSFFIIILGCCWPASVTAVSHFSKKRRPSAGGKKRSALRQKNARERRRGRDMASSISKRSQGKKSGSLAHSLGSARNSNHCCRNGTPGARQVRMRSCSRRTRRRPRRSLRYASDFRT